MADLSAVSVEGPKGVGKTATALQRAATVFSLDRPNVLALVSAAPERLGQASEPVLVDEWQLLPSTWDVVRRAVDEDSRPGRFLLTGSASPDSPPTHSGAGRVLSLRMRPLSLVERGFAGPTVSLESPLRDRDANITGSTVLALEDYVDAIVHGGFGGDAGGGREVSVGDAGLLCRADRGP